MIQTGNRIFLAAAILIAGLAAQWCSAQANPPTDLKVLNAKYEQALAGIQTAIDKALEDWPPAYVAELKKVEQKLQAGGDLDGMLAVQKEIKRFNQEKKIPESAVSDSAVLKSLQLKWRKTPEAIELDRSKRIVALAKSYMAALDEAKKQLTKQGKVDQAIEMKNEIERVKISAPVTAAEFALANAAASVPPDAGKDAKPVQVKPEPDVAEKPSAVPADLRKSLVLYYSFDKDEDDKVTDQSGNKNNATVRGAKHIANGKKGGAYQFDGVKDVIEGADENSLPIGSSPKTVSVWVKPQAVGGIILKYGNDAHITAQGFSFNFGDWNLWLAGYNTDVLSKGKFNPNGWNHLCVTYESSQASIYLNGRLDNSGRFSQDIPAGTNLEIGHNVLNGKAGYFKGVIDEVMIFDRALTDKEVKKLYDAQK